MRTIVHGKRQWFFVAAAGGLLIAAAFSIFFRPAPTSAGADDNLLGFAWSDNIGWISFNCLDFEATLGGTCGVDFPDYGVDVNAAGQFSGYAWSDTIGWISFEPNHVAGCPNPPCRAQTDPNTGITTGWARVCGGTMKGDCTGIPRMDGWDGWISLNGANYGVAFALPPACSFSGYAWGSDVVGWIRWSSATFPPELRGIQYGVTAVGPGCGAQALQVSCEAKPNPVFVNRETTWTATANGGDGDYSYSWSFDGSALVPGNPIKKSYDTIGLHMADVTVTDGNGDQASNSCTVNVIRYRREIRPEPL